MPRQILHHLAKVEKFVNAMICKIQSGIFELPGERVVGIGVLPRTHQACQTIQRFRR